MLFSSPFHDEIEGLDLRGADLCHCDMQDSCIYKRIQTQTQPQNQTTNRTKTTKSKHIAKQQSITKTYPYFEKGGATPRKAVPVQF